MGKPGVFILGWVFSRKGSFGASLLPCSGSEFFSFLSSNNSFKQKISLISIDPCAFHPESHKTTVYAADQV